MLFRSRPFGRSPNNHLIIPADLDSYIMFFDSIHSWLSTDPFVDLIRKLLLDQTLHIYVHAGSLLRVKLIDQPHRAAVSKAESQTFDTAIESQSIPYILL